LPREIVLGNGRMAAALDNRMRIRDFFFPRVGLDNHLQGHQFRIGIWTDGKYAWLHDDWDLTMKYMAETLVTKCLAINNDLGIELEINDSVHHFLNVYLRKLTVSNKNDSRREVRVFFSHDFHIYGEDSGDTAMYEPTLNSIIHYKRKRYFLVDGITERNEGIYQFATGYKEAFGREGTWRDAEDGVLEGNPIAQGSVDSVVSFKLDMQPKSTSILYCWIACGRHLDEVRDLDSRVRTIGVEQMLLETENYWSAWVSRQDLDLSILPHDMARLLKTSLLVMRTHVDNGGSIIASCDSDVLQFNRDTYAYTWPRDGAIIASAFDMMGFRDVSASFFRFCDRVITEDGFFHHKYLPDGSVGSSWHPLVDRNGRPQLPIQEDETALVLCALWKHFEKYRDLEFIAGVYDRLVIRASGFLLTHIDPETGLPKPSFDLWEERTGVFTSTAATVCAALTAAAQFAKVFYDSRRQDMLNTAATRMKEAMLTHLYDPRLGRFVKAIYPDGSRDTTVDSSLSFIFMLGTLDARHEAVEKTMNTVADRLWIKTDIGGLARYENDEYRRISREVQGNPWFISTSWLARWYLAKATSLKELKEGSDLLSWIVRHSSKSGMLAEQIDPYSGAPLSVSPLIWSHAEFVLAVCEYVKRYQEITSADSGNPSH
jgi:glucoamylase